MLSSCLTPTPLSPTDCSGKLYLLPARERRKTNREVSTRKLEQSMGARNQGIEARNRVVVPTRQATHVGGIDSLHESIPGLLKS